MGNYKIRWSDKASQDHESIYLYIANVLQEPETAKQIVFEKIEELVKFPLKYAVNTSIFFQHDNTRRMPVKSYNVYYKVNEEQKIIEIARVLHSRRDV